MSTQKTVYPILFAVSIGHLFNDFFQAVIPSIYPLLKENYNLSFSQIGMITFCFQLASSVFQPVVGMVTDKYPKPFSQVVALGISMIGLILLAYAPNYTGILIAVILCGTGSAIFHPESSRIAYLAAGSKRSFSQAVFQLGGNSGTALCPLFIAWLILPNGQRYIVSLLILGVVAQVIFYFIGMWYRRILEYRKANPSKRFIPIPALRNKQITIAILLLLVLIFSKYFYMASITSYFQFYTMDRFGISAVQAQFFLFLFLMAMAIGTIVGGVLGDKLGRKFIIWFSVLGVAPFSLLLPHANLMWTGVLIVIIGFIMASAFPSIIVYAQELLPRKIGVVSGLFYGFAFGMAGIGSALLGWWADHTSISFVYNVCAFLPLLGIAAYFLPNMKKVKFVKAPIDA